MENLSVNCFEKFSIRYFDKEVKLNDIDKVLIDIIDKVFKSDKKNNFIFIDDYELITIYSFILIGIYSYYENMIDPENDILDIIEKGQKVCYDGKVNTFLGYNNINGIEYIKLKDSKELITNILKENAFQLTIYNGSATRINKVNGVTIKNNITKLFIDKLFGCGIDNLSGCINNSSLMIFNGKEKVLELIENIDIEINGEITPLPELIPMGYWSSDENCILIKNRRKEDILFNITCGMGDVRDLIWNNENIKNVFIFGDKSCESYLETELRDIRLDYNIEKLVVFGGEDVKNIKYFLDNDNEFELYAITRDYILENIKLNSGDNLSNVQKKTLELFENKVEKNICIKFVKENEKFDRCIKGILLLTKELCSYSDIDGTILQFIRLSYHLSNLIEGTIIPLRYSSDNKEDMIKKVSIMNDIKDEFDFTRVEFDLMNRIIVLINEAIGIISNKNAKFDLIREIAKSSNERYTLLVKNDFEIKEFQRFLMAQRINNININKFNRKVKIENFENIILPFYQDLYNIFNDSKFKDVTLICCKREYQRYRNKEREYAQLLNDIWEKNNLGVNENTLNQSFSNDIDIEEEGKLSSIEENINHTIDVNFIRIIENEIVYNSNNTNGVSKYLAKKLIVFKDNNYAFLSENYTVNIIDRTKNDIVTKDINHIELGDEMIFVINNNGSTDIVKETISKLLENKEFGNEYNKYFENNMLWKNILNEYMKVNDFTFHDIANKFKICGQAIHPLTISNWINGNIVGPRDTKFLRYIAEITDDKELQENIDNIIVSCKQVRSIQSKVSRAIARVIINSVVTNDFKEESIDRYVNSLIKDIDDYAYIGEVSHIKDINEEISGQFINRLTERNE
ncbi:DrmE family protein [Clostridium sp. B9]|uniref:DrmE family protein n=1 Tax=Clostridium sp. B9 TaxID=3423224 RepID=UPI003D2ED619